MTTLGRSVEEIAAAIASGEISAAEAATVHLDALARVDKELNAVARLEPEAAAAAAAEKDAAAASTGPLHGVPLAHKDIYGRAEWLHEAGSAVLAGNRA
ncbi:MAG: amidase family protein, partial [Pseudomonadota bacterium]